MYLFITCTILLIIIFLINQTSLDEANNEKIKNDTYSLTNGETNNIATNTNIKNILIILDASGSMLAKFEDESKMSIAKRKLLEFYEKNKDCNIGLMVYGLDSGFADDDYCNNIELLLSIDKHEIKDISNKIKTINGWGKTPLANSILKAKDLLKDKKYENTYVILITDGIDSCGGDPCDAAMKLKEETNIKKIDIIGIGLTEVQKDKIDCISALTGGETYPVNDKESLDKSFNNIKLDKVFPKIEIPIKPIEPEIKKETHDEMALIPEGTFTMGSQNGRDDEQPAHEVYLKSFYMDKYEVNHEQYCKFLNNNGTISEEGINYIDEERAFVFKIDGKYKPKNNYDKYPMIYVSWYGARDYCGSKRKRLPTEAEFEYVARDGIDNKEYPWGDTPNEAGKYAHYSAGFRNGDYNMPNFISCGRLNPNNYDVFDITGNVWEWCNDWYDPEYYQVRERNEPQGPKYGAKKVVRGGSWFNGVTQLKVYLRNHDLPERGYITVGFRCVMTK